MPSHRTHALTPPTTRVLPPDPQCLLCGAPAPVVCAHRERAVVETLDGPLRLLCLLSHCATPDCPSHGHTLSPSAELLLAPPRLAVARDVFARVGHRRFARDWRISQIREELADNHAIVLSEDSLERYADRYQTIVAARERDPAVLAAAYRGCREVVLSIDGLQPDKGHETLYAVREVTQKRI